MRNLNFLECAEIILDKCIGIKAKENLLILTDTSQSENILNALMTSAIIKGVEVGLLTIPQRKPPNLNIVPNFVGSAARAAHAVILIPGIPSMGGNETMWKPNEAGVRVLGATGMTEELMLRVVPGDYEELKNTTHKLGKLFEQSRAVKISSSAGTDVTIKLGGTSRDVRARKVGVYDGICLNPGESDWLPAGVVGAYPLKGGVDGTVVYEGSLVPVGLLEDPVHIQVKDGYMKEIKGGRQAHEFKKYLEKFNDPGVYEVVEIGLGTNPRAKLSGNMLEDERIYGAIHLGMGTYPRHCDGMILKPTVRFDGKVVVRDGEIEL